MDDIHLDLIKGKLLIDEEILWAGKPDSSKRFTVIDILLIPCGIVFGGAGLLVQLVGIMVMLGLDVEDKNSGMGIAYTLFGIPFIIFAWYILFGRFIAKKDSKQRTKYVVTDKRVIIFKVGTPDVIVISKYINQITSLDISRSKNGIGTIRFGEVTGYNSLYGNTGIKSPLTFFNVDSPIFYDVLDADKVYELVSELRKQ